MNKQNGDEDPLCEMGMPRSEHTHPHECNFPNLPAAVASPPPCENDPPRFVIVNTCDAPCRRHIAQWVDGKGYFYCFRTVEPELKRYDGMAPRRPTPIEEFGFEVSVNKSEAIFERVREPYATYEDGTLRKWQDIRWNDKFSVPLVKVRPFRKQARRLPSAAGRKG